MRIFSPHFVIDKQGSKVPYLKRWFLTPWSDDSHKLKRKRLPNVFLHQILRSDDDRALHDHPWNNLSIILRGGYMEYMFERPPVNGVELPNIICKRRRFGSIVFRKAEMAHRLELHRQWLNLTQPEKPCWSIFITWRKRREWGFWCKVMGVIGVQRYTAFKQNFDDTGKKTTLESTKVEIEQPGEVANWIHQETFQSNNGCGA